MLQEYKYSLVKHSGISLQSTALTAEMLSILAAFAALCWGLNLRRAKCCTGGSSQSVAPCSSRVEHGGCRCACTAAAAVGATDSTAAWYATHWTVACTTSAARLPSRWRLLKLSSRQLSRSWLEPQTYLAHAVVVLPYFLLSCLDTVLSSAAPVCLVAEFVTVPYFYILQGVLISAVCLALA